MVVKSATKKKLMDMLVPEEFAHKLADDRKWDDVKILTAQEIAQFCETDSDTAARIHGIISGAASPSRDATSDNSATTSVRLRRGTRRRRTAKTVQELEPYNPEMNADGIPAIYDDELAEDSVFKSIKSAADGAGVKFSQQTIHDLTEAVHNRDMAKLTKKQAEALVAEAA